MLPHFHHQWITAHLSLSADGFFSFPLFQPFPPPWIITLTLFSWRQKQMHILLIKMAIVALFSCTSENGAGCNKQSVLNWTHFVPLHRHRTEPHHCFPLAVLCGLFGPFQSLILRAAGRCSTNKVNVEAQTRTRRWETRKCQFQRFVDCILVSFKEWLHQRKKYISTAFVISLHKNLNPVQTKVPSWNFSLNRHSIQDAWNLPERFFLAVSSNAEDEDVRARSSSAAHAHKETIFSVCTLYGARNRWQWKIHWSSPGKTVRVGKYVPEMFNAA